MKHQLQQLLVSTDRRNTSQKLLYQNPQKSEASLPSVSRQTERLVCSRKLGIYTHIRQIKCLKNNYEMLYKYYFCGMYKILTHFLLFYRAINDSARAEEVQI